MDDDDDEEEVEDEEELLLEVLVLSSSELAMVLAVSGEECCNEARVEISTSYRQWPSTTTPLPAADRPPPSSSSIGSAGMEGLLGHILHVF